jgi:xanthine dehydrogenase YagS FAD-binding subunit
MAVAMRVLDATVETVRPDGGKRTIPMTEFHRLPGTTPQIETALTPGETITAVTLPPPLPGVQIYRKVRDRASYAFALVSVAAVVQTAQGKIQSARLAFGGLAHQPWRVPAAEQTLEGMEPSAARFNEAADLVLAGARGQGSNDFKIPLTRRTLHAVLVQATQG